MVIVKQYTVLDALVTEVVCYHPGEPDASHLVVREQRTTWGDTVQDALAALESVVYLARLGDEGQDTPANTSCSV